MKNSKLPGTTPNAREALLTDRLSLAVVLMITGVTYLGTLRFAFVYDDFRQIVSNPVLKSWNRVPQYFTSSAWKQMFPFDPGNYYRPVFLLWARLNYAVFAGRPLGWHATAIALHLAVTWLVLLVRKLTGRSNAAWLTALIFGLHPIHHEVVAWVSGTSESLFAALYLAAFLGYLQSREGAKTAWMTSSCALYALAMLSNETAIVLPALVFLHSWVVDAHEERGAIKGFGPRFVRAFAWTGLYIPVALAYLAARYKVLSGLGHTVSNASFTVWLMTLPSVLFFYVKNWFAPVRLSENYDVFYQLRPNLAHVILPALIVIGIVGVVWIFRSYLGSRETCFAAAWIVVPLLPALDFVVFKKDELVHDRYFYVPSIGAALLAALLIERAAKKGRVVFGQPLHTIAAALALATVLSICTTWETSFWKDDYTLFSRAHQIAPMNLTAVDNLGVNLIERHEIDQAEALFEAGLREDPGNALVLFNLGRVQYIRKDYAKAEEYTRKAIVLDPGSADSYVALGKIQLKQDRPDDAALSFQRSVELNPYEPLFHTSYGLVLALNGDCTGAIAQFESAIALSPDDTFSQMEISRCRASQSHESTRAASPPTASSSPIQWGFDAAHLASETAAK